MNKINFVQHLSFLFLFLQSVNSFSQEWTEPINISSMNGVNQNPDLCIDKNGTLHCVWTHVIETNYRVIFYSCSMDNGLTWSSPENLSLNIDKSLFYPKIVADSLCNLYVSYDYNSGDPIHSKILFKTNPGNGWSDADTVSGNMLNSSKNRLIIDNSDRIYCFWNHAVEGGDYYYRYFENGNWSDFFNPYGPGLVIIELVTDATNNIHVLGGHTDSGSYLDYCYFNYETNLWSEPITFSDNTFAIGSDLDIDGNGYPHFSWRQKTPGLPNPFEEDSTLYRYYDGVNWSLPELVTEDPAGHKIQIVNEESFIIDWEKAENEYGNIICYEKDLNGNWIGETVIVNAAGTEVFLKSTNMLHFLYRAKPDEDNLNIYYTHKIVDTTTNNAENKFSLKSLEVFPNPFTEVTNIEFTLVEESHVILKIHAFDGKLIKTLLDGSMQRGIYKLSWDATDNQNNKVQPKAYLVRLIAGKNIISRSVIFLK
jgi:hypothetical protein